LGLVLKIQQAMAEDYVISEDYVASAAGANGVNVRNGLKRNGIGRG